MSFTFVDFISIVEIASILFASGFALLLPLYAYLKNSKLALKVSIPLSFSVEILIGYIFYSLGQIRIFPITYLVLILAINIALTIKLDLLKNIRKIKFKFNWKTAVPAILIIASVLFSRFYDAILNSGPGALDAAAHAQYVLDLDLYGRLSCTYYSPGFHILIYPLSKVIEMANVYRFAGPVLGIVTTLFLYLLFKDFFKNKISSYFLILALGLPVLNILTLQTISFFPTALTFIFVPMLLYVLIKPQELSIKNSLVFYIISIVSLALTVPYLLVQFIPAIVFLCIIALIAIRKLHREYFALLSKMLIISLLGFVLAFGHVYLQSAISKKNNTYSFPQIAITHAEDSGLAISTNLDEESNFLAKHQTLSQIASKSTLVKNYLIPMVITGRDTIAAKGLRPINSALGIGAYIWIVISLLMIYFGIKKKDRTLLVFGSFILVFAVATQTGVLEMSTYRGRAGWYLLLFVAVSSVYFLDLIIKKIPPSISYILLLILLIISFLKPPVFYRPYYSEYFSKAKEIAHRFPNQRILFVTDVWRVTVVSKNFDFEPLEISSLGDYCSFDQCFLIMENKFFELDPILSQKLAYVDRDLESFKANQAESQRDQKSRNEEIKSSVLFGHYGIYWQDENISIYQFVK